jgi:hypothetical protein
MTIFYLFLAFALACGLSFYQYYYKNLSRNKITLMLFILRTLSVFGLLLLLINPILTKNNFEIQKAPLCLVIDNSASIVDLKANQNALKVFQTISENSAIKDKFEVQTYQFDSDFSVSDSINFKGKQTNLDIVAQNLKSINKNKTFPTVLITDGNQTAGNDFVYSFPADNKVFPIVVGDTTTFLDLKVSQINVNKYAFQKNKFPAEVFLQYSGNKTINANFTISQGNSILAKQTVGFSATKKSVVINVLLPANNVGLQIFRANISSNEPEKNTYNNTKNFAVEVIDQRTNIAIVSAMNHPDVGALKRGIETNIQRKVSLVKPSEIQDIGAFNVLVFYQPNESFKPVFSQAKAAGINTLIVTGINTDFNFLNQNQTTFSFRMTSQKEDFLSEFNTQFNLFALDDIGFEQFPPLQNPYGTIATNENVSILLSSKIRNINTNMPLIAFAENQGKRNAFLFGENTWKWRLQSHVDNKSFEKFDTFIDKTIQFLASNNAKKSLIVNHESFYNSGDAIEITAQFFNKNYEFDDKAQLNISVVNKKTKAVKNFDFLKTNNAFKVNLDGLSAGQYTFVVKELNSKNTYNGYFEVLDFDIEKQFVNPDLQKLKQLSTLTNGAVFMPNQTDKLIDELLKNNDYKAIEKAVIQKSPLVDWVWLLVFVAICLATEWFVRKYNGML